MDGLAHLPEDRLVDRLRNGQRVTVSLHENVDSPPEAAWTIHEVVARVGERLGGFMRIVNYPADRFDARMRHPRDFLARDRQWRRVTGDRDPREILKAINTQAREKEGIRLYNVPTAAEAERCGGRASNQSKSASGIENG